MHRALDSGRKKQYSAGASAPGVYWNTNRTPSMSISWPVRSTMSVGGNSAIDPVLVEGPNPAPTEPSGPGGTALPYMYDARRAMTLPASTFSDTDSSMKPTGTM